MHTGKKTQTMSCLFRALASFVPGVDEHVLRQKICTYLILNLPIAHARTSDYVRWESDLDLTTYVRRMRSASVWGGGIEIQVFCELYNFSVTVLNLRDQHSKIVFQPRPSRCGVTRQAEISWNGGHFEPVLSAVVDEF